MTARQVSSTAGMKIFGRLALMSSESTKPVAKPSILPPMALGSIPVILRSRVMAAVRFHIANPIKTSRQMNNPPTMPSTNQSLISICKPRSGTIAMRKRAGNKSKDLSMATVGSDRLMGMAEMRLRMRVLTRQVAPAISSSKACSIGENRFDRATD